MHREEAAKKILDDVGRTSHPEKFAVWVFQTDDCRETYETLRSRGVKFLVEPRERPYGIEAIFQDLYGNQFVITQPRTRRSSQTG